MKETSIQLNPNVVVTTKEQRSPEWFKARRAKLTASTFNDYIKVGRGGKNSVAKETLIRKKVAEYLAETDNSCQTVNPLEWGCKVEPWARELVNRIIKDYGLHIEEVGFVVFNNEFTKKFPSAEYLGASPDGIICDQAGVPVALIEIKCPNTATHVQYVSTQEIPVEYYQQMKFQAAILDIPKVLFVSFDPRLDDDCLYMKLIEFEEDELKYTLKQAFDFFKDCTCVLNNVSTEAINRSSIETLTTQKPSRTPLNLNETIAQLRTEFVLNDELGIYIENRKGLDPIVNSVPTISEILFNEAQEEQQRKKSIEDILNNIA